MDFSLFFFSNYKVKSDNKYHLLLESARFADRHGFKAVWTPERHFHEFGGLFPNPSVTSAALAMITSRLELRSGSVVSPLHDSVRIAEEWSVVDNLSLGRVALSFASGWNGNDFALGKDRYQHRHQVMQEQIEEVRKLWKGGYIRRKNGLGKEVDFRIFPSPVQQELPIWITAAGNEQTYIQAGEMGVNLLTHLLGQEMEELSGKIRAYRDARARSGYPPQTGRVALMLHTYVGEDMAEVESLVEKPFIEYLKSATSLSKILYEEAGLKAEDIPEEDREMMLKMSYKRYSRNSALIGTVGSCSEMLERLERIGVDEIACLVDFGIGQDKVLEGLVKLGELQQLHKGVPIPQ